MQTGPFAEKLTKTGAHHHVIVGHQNPQRLRCDTRRIFGHAAFQPTRVIQLCRRTAGRAWPLIAPRYAHAEARSLTRRALYLQMATKQSEAFTDAEQPQSGLVFVLVI